MKKLLLIAPLLLFLAAVGCKTTLEPGGAYAPTNSLGQVIYNDTGLALADTSYKLAYETTLAVFRFERQNRAALWAISPEIKHTLDKARVQVQGIDRRWAEARQMYKLNPTPAGLSVLQTVLAEIQRILPIVQAQLDPVYSTLTVKH